MTILRKLVQSDFGQIENLKHLAQSAYDADQMPSVVELLQLYLEHFPEDAKAWFNYGDALRVIGISGAAAVALAKAEKLCPSDMRWTVQSRLGMLFSDSGDLTAAEKWFAQALEADEAKQKSWLWVLRGANLALEEMLDEAENCHRRAIAVNERDDEAHLNLAMVCRAKGKYELAAIAAETALSLDPNCAKAALVLKSLEGARESSELIKRLRG